MTVTDLKPDHVVEELHRKLRGRLITRSDEGYDDARGVYNGGVDRYPWAVARVADVADVITCVDFARDHMCPSRYAVVATTVPGSACWDGALVIDFCGLRSTTVDPAAGTVRVDAGCTWGDVDHATGAFGLATPSGFVSTTGVAGLTLGGGAGYLTRHFGLTVDNLVSADVVLADGSFVTASADNHPDLFWALRGGGGNFGVVTSFTFRCHPVGEAAWSSAAPCSTTSPTPSGVPLVPGCCCPPCPMSSTAGSACWRCRPRRRSPSNCGRARLAAIVWCYSGPHDHGRRGAGAGP